VRGSVDNSGCAPGCRAVASCSKASLLDPMAIEPRPSPSYLRPVAAITRQQMADEQRSEEVQRWAAKRWRSHCYQPAHGRNDGSRTRGRNELPVVLRRDNEAVTGASVFNCQCSHRAGWGPAVSARRASRALMGSMRANLGAGYSLVPVQHRQGLCMPSKGYDSKAGTWEP